jgi:16S rRNA (cytidine1402-2'-O)-methyltransferase
MSGRATLVGTPIGNLGDITMRAVETLRNASRIYAEDTRRTQVLLSHLGIDGKKLLSLNAHASERALATVIEILRSGEDIALVTDAGMPSVSDPGTELVRAIRQAGFEVTVVPGPSAVTTAVAASGLVDAGFTFLGFLPRKGSKRRATLANLVRSEVPTVFFESPHRIAETLLDLHALAPSRRIAICRELTKKFEEVRVVTLEEAVAPGFKEEWLGELTLVLAASEEPAVTEADFDLEVRARELLESGASVREVVASLQRETQLMGLKLRKQDLYARVQLLADAPSDEDDPDAEA